MDLSPFFKSVLEQDRAPVVLCDLQHIIVYMNPAAIARYQNRGGVQLLGSSLFACHNPASCALIEQSLSWFSADKDHNLLYESHNEAEDKDVYIVALRDDAGELIGYYEKHEYRTGESAPFYDFS